MTVTHELKTRPVYFDAVVRGEKTFEVSRDDRGFQKGDLVRLLRTSVRSPHQVDYDYHGKPNHEITCEISYVLTGGQFGIEPGYVVLGLNEPTP